MAAPRDGDVLGRRGLSAGDREEVAAEARRMIDFAAADAAVRDVRFEAAVG